MAPPRPTTTPGPRAGPAADPRSDEQLVAAMNAGREPASTLAFEAIYSRHRDWVHRLAIRFAADQDEALDVMQEAFMYFLGKFPGFQLSAKLTTFLYPAVKHIALAKRRRKLPRPTDGEALERSMVPVPPPERSDLGELAGVLNGLSDVHREVILLRFVDAMSLEEIGAALGIPTGTVKSRLHNAIAALRADPRTRRYFLGDENAD